MIAVRILSDRLQLCRHMIDRKLLSSKSCILLHEIQNECKNLSQLCSNYAYIKSYSDLAKDDSVYIADPEAGNFIASCISKDWNGGYILEANPGSGVLTHHLLQSGHKRLRVFEKNIKLLPSLQVLSSLYPNLEIIQENLMLLPLLDAKKSYDLDHFKRFFQNIPQCSWNNDVPFRLFSIISSVESIKFFRYLLVILPMRTSLFAFGRCELFLLIKEQELKCLEAVPGENLSKYRWSTVLYNIFFEYEILKKFPSEVLFPFSQAHFHTKLTSNKNWYLIKLTPRSNLFSNLVFENKLQEFYSFVRHHLANRTSFIIPSLELWIPHYGPRLIKDGLNVFAKFGDLSPKQILLLFNQFASSSEYKNCSFLTTAHISFKKRLLSCHDDDDDDIE